MTMHSRSKEQREAVRQLIYLVLTRDMATFNPDRFKHWIKETDSKFRKVGLMLKFEIKDRFVYFRIKEIRNGRIIYQFDSSTRVSFDERDVVLSYRGIESGRKVSGIDATSQLFSDCASKRVLLRRLRARYPDRKDRKRRQKPERSVICDLRRTTGKHRSRRRGSVSRIRSVR